MVHLVGRAAASRPAGNSGRLPPHMFPPADLVPGGRPEMTAVFKTAARTSLTCDDPVQLLEFAHVFGTVSDEAARADREGQSLQQTTLTCSSASRSAGARRVFGGAASWTQGPVAVIRAGCHPGSQGGPDHGCATGAAGRAPSRPGPPRTRYASGTAAAYRAAHDGSGTTARSPTG